MLDDSSYGINVVCGIRTEEWQIFLPGMVALARPWRVGDVDSDKVVMRQRKILFLGDSPVEQQAVNLPKSRFDSYPRSYAKNTLLCWNQQTSRLQTPVQKYISVQVGVGGQLLFNQRTAVLLFGPVLELVYRTDLKSVDRKVMSVRSRPGLL